ncbi:hypothetical protein PRIPAC_72780 [Pristionchus pacificus]|uniref:Uncharacterized protein n=1 Tax=Pristionchus pacificus TaxID=54126 RepID=A0A2A6CAC0_PRIPA|nr:hypothetical protein PRIPAC_72780 [Pristionchus pacificus]|eukprot:PDM75046.1 hypothetical protein PRIPAC_40427 [Pristionchus pacificus]
MLRYFVFICIATCILAKWGQWKEVDGMCSDTCGMCGTKVVAVRKCLSKTCQGSAERSEICGETLCLFPRRY